MLHAWETQIVLSLNAVSDAHLFFRTMSIFFASYVEYVLALMLVFFIIHDLDNVKKNISYAITAVCAALLSRFVVKNVITHFYMRARPYVFISNLHTFIPKSLSENFESFPSGHAIFFFALAWVIARHNKRWGIFFLGAAALMGIARVAVGVHWPTDILGGMILGIIVGELCIYFLGGPVERGVFQVLSHYDLTV